MFVPVGVILPRFISEVRLPTIPLRLALPLNPVAVNPLASLAVMVALNGKLAICGEPMVPHCRLATGPGRTAKTLLAPTIPPGLALSATPASTAFTLTLPVQTPEANVADVGLMATGPL